MLTWVPRVYNTNELVIPLIQELDFGNIILIFKESDGAVFYTRLPL